MPKIAATIRRGHCPRGLLDGPVDTSLILEEKVELQTKVKTTFPHDQGCHGVWVHVRPHLGNVLGSCVKCIA